MRRLLSLIDAATWIGALGATLILSEVLVHLPAAVYGGNWDELGFGLAAYALTGLAVVLPVLALGAMALPALDLHLALPAAHVQHDLGAARLTRARRRRLCEHGGLWRELHEALLAPLRLEAGGLEPRHRLVVHEPNHLGYLRVVRNDFGRKDQERHDEVREEESSGGGEGVR